jgi:hypothetical protein
MTFLKDRFSKNEILKSLLNNLTIQDKIDEKIFKFF